MKMLNKITFFVVFLLFFLFNLDESNAQQNSQCIAVITEVNGNVLVKRADNDTFVKTYWGTQLFQEDQVKTQARSSATLTFSNNSIVTLGENSTMSISGNGSSETNSSGNIRKVSSAVMVSLSAFMPKGENRQEEGALAGLRSFNPDKSIDLESPYNTVIKTSRPTFSWNAIKEFDNYIVNLYDNKGLVWSKKITGNTLLYPENEKELEAGQSYFWNVEGEELINNEKSDNQKFSILSAEKSKEVSSQEVLIRNTFSTEPESSGFHSVLGAYYINQGLLQDAINEFLLVSEINKEAPIPHEILGSLYNSVGNKDKAIEELKKALSLSKNNDNR
jgi:hypothetical protein